jgi:hypothetical protein
VSVYGSPELTSLALAIYLLTRWVDNRLGRQPGAKPLPRVSPFFAAGFCVFGAYNMWLGVHGRGVAFVFGALAIAASVDSLIRWRGERELARRADAEFRKAWHEAPHPTKREPLE